jgi:hypothetical protein
MHADKDTGARMEKCIWEDVSEGIIPLTNPR